MNIRECRMVFYTLADFDTPRREALPGKKYESRCLEFQRIILYLAWIVGPLRIAVVFMNVRPPYISTAVWMPAPADAPALHSPSRATHACARLHSAARSASAVITPFSEGEVPIESQGGTSRSSAQLRPNCDLMFHPQLMCAIN